MKNLKNLFASVVILTTALSAIVASADPRVARRPGRPGSVVVRPGHPGHPGHPGVRPGFPGHRPGGVVVVPGRRPIYRPAPGWRPRRPAHTIPYNPGFNYSSWLYNEMRYNRVEEIGSTFLATQDYDVIPVRECGINRVALHVKYADAIIDHLVIVMANGQQITVEANEYYQEGSISGWKALPSYTSCVSQIIVIGSTVSRGFAGTQAEIEVLGAR